MEKTIRLPLSHEDIQSLRAGDLVRLTGVAYTARDAAHKKLAALIEQNAPLPFELDGACIYYAGPCPAALGEVIGPCGPTTSGRMDSYTPSLIKLGLSAMVGKGARSLAVKEAMQGRAVYFAATGGAALLISSCITKCETVAFEELGAEAVRKIWFEELPVIVAIDTVGGDLFEK